MTRRRSLTTTDGDWDRTVFYSLLLCRFLLPPFSCCPTQARLRKKLRPSDGNAIPSGLESCRRASKKMERWSLLATSYFRTRPPRQLSLLLRGTRRMQCKTGKHAHTELIVFRRPFCPRQSAPEGYHRRQEFSSEAFGELAKVAST